MRLLRFFQWFFLFLAASPALAVDCGWEMPVDNAGCEQTIKWKVRDEKQAKSTCLEYFPTTFVSGVPTDKTKKEIRCTVARQYQCDWKAGSVSIFDKCYTFNKEVKMKDYLAKKGTNEDICGKDGSLPVFFTMTQAKHIAMAANKKNIFKMWVNIKSDGMILEKSTSPGIDEKFLLTKDQWKLHKEHYWKGDNLEVTPIVGDDYVVPAAARADYMFFRTKNDYWNKMFQGSFERADEEATAAVVCEYQAKLVPEQKWYCDKLGDLQMNYQYSASDKRCLYTTLTHFTLEGTKTAIENFKGCAETPSPEHSSGLDDATATDGKKVYEKLTKDGTYRIAAIKVDTSIATQGSQWYASSARGHCDGKAWDAAHRQPFEIYDHFGNKDFGIRMKPDWWDNYPKDECTDFPEGKMNSNTLAIKEGKLLDVPVPVRFKAICSFKTNVDCELDKNLCPTTTTGRQCEPADTWNSETSKFAKCVCPKFHKLHDGKCKWQGSGDGDSADHSCGAMRQYPSGHWLNLRIADWETLRNGYSDYVDYAVARVGCRMQFLAHPISTPIHQNPSITGMESGEFVIPQHQSGTLNGWSSGMSASSVKCVCNDRSFLCDQACKNAP